MTITPAEYHFVLDQVFASAGRPEPVRPAAEPAPAADAVQRVLAEVERNRIELIRFLWVDHGSITRGKAVAAGSLAARMDSGIGLAKTRQSAGLSDVGPALPGFDAVGEVRLVPDPDSFVVLPHAPGSAAMLCDLRTLEDQPWDACPAASCARRWTPQRNSASRSSRRSNPNSPCARRSRVRAGSTCSTRACASTTRASTPPPTSPWNCPGRCVRRAWTCRPTTPSSAPDSTN